MNQFVLTESDECSTALSRIEDRIHPHSYFKYFSLSLEDFDTDGNKTYHDYLVRSARGGWFYYLPIFCDRFGMKVDKKYDGGDNQWLSMKKNEDKQGAVIFHGVKYLGAEMDEEAEAERGSEKLGREKKKRLNSILASEK